MIEKKEKLFVYEKSIKELDDLIRVQCSDGNWNSNPYMHGLANGLLLAKSLFENKRVEYLEAPEKWLKDEGMEDGGEEVFSESKS